MAKLVLLWTDAAIWLLVLAALGYIVMVRRSPNLVASFPPHVQLKLGDDVAVAVDTKNLHFFDEASGSPLR